MPLLYFRVIGFKTVFTTSTNTQKHFACFTPINCLRALWNLSNDRGIAVGFETEKIPYIVATSCYVSMSMKVKNLPVCTGSWDSSSPWLACLSIYSSRTAVRSEIIVHDWTVLWVFVLGMSHRLMALAWRCRWTVSVWQLIISDCWRQL